MKEIFGEQDKLVLHLVVLEMGFGDRTTSSGRQWWCAGN
ncbi:unnamed protein product [Brassica oleracea]|uniref:(rape) hypothetical protein n=1 Tax=Brassica napus TaxID=3708 RepID=A0A816M694_BRANA|nr:unnamed protein product [Brassica napus]